VSALPAPLKRWAPQLSLLQRDLALAIAPWVQRLSMSIGAFADAPSQPTGAPDGFDGVARKGPYERLLATEWLYADVVPEEFLRRAAQGEHLFSKLAVREPQQARRCLVLFDAGPSQLGTPRIAHLAALIVFAARCEAVGAKLSWGVLQGPVTDLQEGFTRERGLKLLKGRSVKEPTADRLDTWLQAASMPADDVWLVGSPALMRLPLAARCQQLEVADLLVPDVRALELGVRKGSRAGQRLRLELPPPALCTSLLRAPFKVDAPKITAPLLSLPCTGLVFSASGNRLFSLSPTGALIAIALPNPGGTARRLTFQPPPLEQVIGAGWFRGLLCVTARFDAQGRIVRVVAYPLTKRAERKGDPWVFAVHGDDLPFRPTSLTDVVVFANGDQRKLLLAFGDGLLTLDDSVATFARQPIVAHTQRSERLLALTVDSKGRRDVSTYTRQGLINSTPLDGVGDTYGFFAGGQHWPLPLVALGPSPTTGPWLVVDASRSTHAVDVPDGCTVVGLTMHAGGPSGLILRGRDRCSLLHATQAAVRVLAISEVPIVEVAADFEWPRIAFLDARGSIGLFDASHPPRLLIGLPDASGKPHHLSFVERLA